MLVNRIGWLLTATMPLAVVLRVSPPASGQPITPDVDGTGTVVNLNGTQFDITGGTTSGDGSNLFHSFQQFGLNAGQIAQFLSNPGIRNILGRVVGGDVSVINGLIQVTGGNSNLFLMNPAGLIFGPSASLNVPGAFTATTASGIGFDSGWFSAAGPNQYNTLVGNPNQFAFTAATPGTLFNAGHLSVAPGQNLTLLGGTTLNTGTLSAPGGNITVAAVPGESLVRLSQTGTILSLEVLPENTIDELSFNPLTLPQLLTNTAVQNATGAIVQPDGTVNLTGAGITIPTDSGTAIVSGTLDVASSQVGGTIYLLGNQVGVLGASIDASGPHGGGTVLIGGDYQGQGPLPTAEQTFVGQNATINADAQQQGDGGTVVVWADDNTQFYGHINARGGNQAGDGGLVEVSGKETLHFDGTVDTTAAQGNAGNLLLDPKHIWIQGGPHPVSGHSLFSDNSSGTSIISGSTLAAAIDAGNVTLQANTDIWINANVTAAVVGHGLTLQAGRSINFQTNRRITLNNGDFSATINDAGAIAGERDAGAAQFVMWGNSEIATNGGDVTIDRGSFGGSAIGEIRLNGAAIDAGGGNISITGQAQASGSNTRGIDINSGSVIQTAGTGTVTLDGTGGNGTAFNDGQGIRIADAGTRIRAQNGAIDLTGVGNGTGDDNDGILIETGAVVESTGTGAINLHGTSGTSPTSNDGIKITDSGSAVRSTNGDITITGIGIGTFFNSNGIEIVSGGAVESTGSGSITLDGTGGAGGDLNEGIYIGIGSNRVSSVNGDITLIGTATGTGNGNWGVYLDNGTVVEATGTGNVNLTGTGSGVDNEGIHLFDSQVSAGTGNITFTTDEVLTTGGATAIQGSGTVRFQPLTPLLGMTVGGTVNNSRLNLNAAKLATLQDGFSQVIFGSGSGNGNIALRDYTFSDPLLIQAHGNWINAVGGTFTGLDDATLTLEAHVLRPGAIDMTGVTVGSGDITLTGNLMDLEGTVQGTGTLTLQTLDPTQDIGIASAPIPNRMDLQAADLNNLQDGFSAIIIGRADGTNTITLHPYTFQDPVTIAGGSTVVGADQATTWTLSGPGAGNISGFGQPVSFANIENLTGGTANDTFVFTHNSAGIIGALDGGAGINTLDYSGGYTNPVAIDLANNTAPGTGSIANIQAVIGGGGDNTLIGANGNNNWNITVNDSGTVNGTFNFAGFENLTGGSAADTFNFSDGVGVSGTIDGGAGSNSLNYAAYTSAVNLNLATATATGIGNIANIQSATGGSGGNTLVGENSVNTWTIAGANSGTVNGTFSFTNFENLTGGNLQDTFVFNDGATVGGVLDGGNPAVLPGDRLDYSAYTTAVTVDAANLVNIEQVVGGATGGDTFVGGNGVNTWTFTGSDAGELNGAIAFSNFENFTGGANADTFNLNAGFTLANIDGGGGDNALVGDNAINTWNITGLNSGSATGVTTFTNIQTLTGGTNIDNFALNGGTVTSIEGSAGSNSLTGDNMVNTWNITAVNAGDVNGSTFSNIETLTGGNNTDTFNLNGGTVADIDGGAGDDGLTGDNTINTWNVTAVNGGDVNGSTFSNIENLTGGNNTDTFNLNGGTVADIDGGLGNDGLRGDNTVNTWNVTAANAGNVNGSTFSNIENLTGGNNTDTFNLNGGTVADIDGGAGDDGVTGDNTINTWNVTAANAGDINGSTFSNIENLTGGNNADAFTLNGGTVASIDGGAGNDGVTGDNAINTWNVTAVNGGDVNGSTFSNIENLTGGNNADTFTLNGGTVTSIDGGGGNDDVTGDNTINTWNVTVVNGGDVNGSAFSNIENLTGGSNADSFTLNGGTVTSIDGSGGNDGVTGDNTINTWNVTAANAGAVNGSAFSNIENLTGGNNADTFTLNGGTVTSIDGGGGNDGLTGENTVNTWNVTAANAGDVNGSTFSNIENLTGGNNADSFTLNGGTVASIDGGGGNDGVTGDNTINAWNVTAANAGDVNGSAFSNIENLTGGSNADSFALNGGTVASIDGGAGNDNLTGDNAVNAWNITAVNTGDVNGSTFSNIENLTGGNNADSFTLNGGTVTSIDGGAGNDNLMGDNAVNTWNITAANTGDVNGSTFSNIENLTGGHDADSFTLNGGTVANVDGGAGDNVLTGDNIVNTWDVTGVNVGNLNGTTTFSNIQTLAGGATDDSFNFVGAAAQITGNIDGVGVTDTLNYAAYTGGNVDVNLAAGTATGVGGAIASIESIRGNAAFNNTLTGDNTANTWTIVGADTGNLNGAIAFTNIQNLTGGSNADTFVFSNNSADLSGIVNGNTGNDSLNYTAYTNDVTLDLANNSATGTGGIASIEAVIGGSGNNTLIGDNINNAWTVSGANSGDLNSSFTFSNIQNLTGGTANDSFNLSGGNVSTIDGNTGNNTLIGDNTSNTWAITAANGGDINGTTTFSNIQNLVGGAVDDSFFLNGGTVNTVNGGNGNNTLTGDNTSNIWNITAANGGNINGTTAFSNIQNLTGGSADDSFSFIGPNAEIDGNLNGADALDTLDYSTYTGSDVVVNLAASTATGVGGTVSNIEDFQGSATVNNILVGTNGPNIWNITGLNSGTLNDQGFVDFQILQGGDGTDSFTLNGGDIVALDGGAGIDTVTADNTVNVWTIHDINEGELNGIAFSNIENLTGGNFKDSFTFIGAEAQIAGKIDGGAATDTLNYTTYTGSAVTIDLAAETATGVGGPIASFEAATGNDAFNNTLIGKNVGNTWSITGPNSGTLNGGFAFSQFQTLQGGNAVDTFVLQNGTIGTIDGAAGNNTLAGGNTANQWNITDANAGSATGVSAFSNIQNLIGGDTDDTFSFIGANARIDGNIDGIGVTDTLDYSTYTGGTIDVVLGTNTFGTATGVGGTIFSIENVIGMAASPTNELPPIPFMDLVARNDRNLFTANSGNYIEYLLDIGKVAEATSHIDLAFSNTFADYFDMGSGERQSFAALQTGLRDAAAAAGVEPAVIYTFVQPEHLHVVLMMPEGDPVRARVEVNRETLLATVKELRWEIGDPTARRSTSYLKAAQKLYQWIVAPLELELELLQIDTLIFAMDRGLRRLPLAVLHDGEKFLVEKYSLSTIPSLYLTDNRVTQNLQNASVLAMGMSEQFPDNQAPLPAVPVEIETIADRLWQGEGFLNQDFTLKNLQQQREEHPFRIVHLATHGYFKRGAAENSYIQLWDEKLRIKAMKEQQWYDPPVELLVLSACHTAVGDAQVELGFAGLAVQTGAKSALASLWYVNDTATLGLIASFYERLRTAPIKVEALRKVQIAMLRGEIHVKSEQLLGTMTEGIALPPALAKLGDRNFVHPYYWAGFAVVGNPW